MESLFIMPDSSFRLKKQQGSNEFTQGECGPKEQYKSYNFLDSN